MAAPHLSVMDERDDIQGLVVSGYGHLPLACYLLLEIKKPPAARAWLGEVAGYDLRSAPGLADTVRNALTTLGFSEQAVSGGIDVIARLPGGREQRALAAILLRSAPAKSWLYCSSMPRICQ